VYPATGALLPHPIAVGVAAEFVAGNVTGTVVYTGLKVV
jgi:hypothetical protein